MLVMYRIPTVCLTHSKETHPIVSVSSLKQYNFALRDDTDQKTKGNYTVSEAGSQGKLSHKDIAFSHCCKFLQTELLPKLESLLGLKKTGCLYFYLIKSKDTETCFECKQDTTLL